MYEKVSFFASISGNNFWLVITYAEQLGFILDPYQNWKYFIAGEIP